MNNVVSETFRPYGLVGAMVIQFFLILAGVMFLFVGVIVHAPLGLFVAVVFFAMAVGITYLKRLMLGQSTIGHSGKVKLLIFAGVWVSIALIVRSSGLHLNMTDSVPVGLYRDVPSAQISGYAGICIPLDYLRQGQAAGLDIPIAPAPTTCPGGVVPILKPLEFASPKNVLTYSADGFQRNGQWLVNTRPKTHSRTGQPLKHYPFGTYTSGIWALSSYSADSWDSRYFGPIQESSIQFRATPFLTADQQKELLH